MKKFYSINELGNQAVSFIEKSMKNATAKENIWSIKAGRIYNIQIETDIFGGVGQFPFDIALTDEKMFDIETQTFYAPASVVKDIARLIVYDTVRKIKGGGQRKRALDVVDKIELYSKSFDESYIKAIKIASIEEAK